MHRHTGYSACDFQRIQRTPSLVARARAVQHQLCQLSAAESCSPRPLRVCNVQMTLPYARNRKAWWYRRQVLAAHSVASTRSARGRHLCSLLVPCGLQSHARDLLNSAAQTICVRSWTARIGCRRSLILCRLTVDVVELACAGIAHTARATLSDVY